MVVGPFIAGLLLTRWGPAEVFAALRGGDVRERAAGLPARDSAATPSPEEPMDAGDVVKESLGGFRFLFGNATPDLLVLVLSGGIVLWGALDVLFVAVAISLLERAGMGRFPELGRRSGRLVGAPSPSASSGDDAWFPRSVAARWSSVDPSSRSERPRGRDGPGSSGWPAPGRASRGWPGRPSCSASRPRDARARLRHPRRLGAFALRSVRSAPRR